MSSTEWFTNAGVGLFVHWDHASQAGIEIGWPLIGGLPHLPSPVPATADDYHRTADTFDPQQWDPQALVAAAQKIGAQYAIFTTRHHAGWSTWPSATGDFSIASSPFGQRGGDLVRDFTDAFRAAGIRVGLYYSLSDWHHPDYLPWTDDQRPYDNRPRMGTVEQWQRFRTYLKDQLTELLTQYGQIDLLWFDGDWERTTEEWDTDDLVAHIRSLAPDILMNNRMPGHGDYVTPEQYIPSLPPEGPWECGVTISQTWGYVPTDTDIKSAFELVRTLVQVRCGGGNILLNVGPTGNGEITATESERIDQISEWLSVHSESVIDIERGLESWQFYGPSSRRGDSVYLHLLAWPTETTSVRGIPVKRVKAARMMSTGEQLPFKYQISPLAVDEPDPFGELIVSMPAARPDTVVPVIELTIEGLTDLRPPVEQLRV